MVVFVIGTGLCFPHTYRALEGDDFWALTMDFWRLKLSMQPAITQWTTDFLLQFYGTPFVGAGIQAIVLGLTALLAENVIGRWFPSRNWMRWLGLVPSLVLGYYCTFDLCLMLEALSFFALLAVYQHIGLRQARLVVSLLMLPLGYMLMSMPALAVMLLAIMADEALRCHTTLWRWQLLGLPILGIMPIIYSQQVAFIPFKDRYTKIGTYFDAVTSHVSHDSERLHAFIHTAEDEDWYSLMVDYHCRRDAQQGDAVALRFALLAESAQGKLADNIFTYPIQEESQFLFPHKREYITCQFNRLFYRNLGIYDEAFHQAEEYYLLQRNGLCFSSLRQMVDYSIREGEWEVAEKFLHLLEKATCHGDFVRDARQQMQKARKEHREEIPLRANNFVGGYPFPVEMVYLARYYKDPARRAQFMDYAMCAYLLRGDLMRFNVALHAFDVYKDRQLPQTYKDALEALQKQNNQQQQ